MPPARARAMAIGASVTVSIAADTIGMASSMERVRRVRVSTSAGSTDDSAGTSKHVVERQTELGELRRPLLVLGPVQTLVRLRERLDWVFHGWSLGLRKRDAEHVWSSLSHH